MIKFLLMKQILLTIAFMLAGVTAFAVLPTGFIDNMEQAKVIASEKKQPILAVFSGSDWCYWCKRLDDEVLSQKYFIENVTNNVVLLYVDSPRDKSKLSAHARSANPFLLQKYGIRGFPTLLLLDKEGGVLFNIEHGLGRISCENWTDSLVSKVENCDKYVKYILPMRNKFRSIRQEAGNEIAKINDDSELDEKKKRKEIEKVVKKAKKSVQELQRELSLAEIPAEMKKELDLLNKELRHFQKN